MAINVTRWSPDTCGCVMEYAWDSESSNEDRIHTFSKMVNVCEAHKVIVSANPTATGHGRTYNSALEQNQRKNLSLSHAMEHLPHLVEETDEGAKVLKKGVSYDFSYEGEGENRVLKIGFSGKYDDGTGKKVIANLANNHKNSLKALLDTKIGIGKVVVN